MKFLMKSDLSNANDLELIQLGTHGDILSLKELHYQNYRLKTFFSGWVAGETATSLNVDLIPSRYSQIPRIIKSKRIPIDAAFIQITLSDNFDPSVKFFFHIYSLPPAQLMVLTHQQHRLTLSTRVIIVVENI